MAEKTLLLRWVNTKLGEDLKFSQNLMNAVGK